MQQQMQRFFMVEVVEIGMATSTAQRTMQLLELGLEPATTSFRRDAQN
jgi:hypothetical protein